MSLFSTCGWILRLGVTVSLLGFRRRYQLEDRTQYVDYSTRELQEAVTPGQVLQILKDGHERFRTGRRLTRDLGRQVSATAAAQHPLADRPHLAGA